MALVRLSDYLIPLLLAGAAIYALGRRVDVFSALTTGAGEGLRIVLRILPPLVSLLTAVYMLRASGALEVLTRGLTPALAFLGIPPETVGLLLIRPVSGSGALAVGSEIMQTYGPDSAVGRWGVPRLHFTPWRYITALRASAAPDIPSRRLWRRTSWAFWPRRGR